MFRLTHHLKEALAPETVPVRHLDPSKPKSGPVVIWNLVRRCNLACRHCYAISGDVDFPNELTTGQVFEVMRDLRENARVPVLILSGGEPLLRPDIFEITARAKELGFFLTLSTNGTLIDEPMADRIAAAGYDYVGISLDGVGDTHDRFRRLPGAYRRSLDALRALRDRGVKVGVRFTMTEENEHHLAELVELCRTERFPKFYLSHLVYAGRGNKNRATDSEWSSTRRAMDWLIATALLCHLRGEPLEIVTGNNDADAAYLLGWVARNAPDGLERLEKSLRAWGGNASGVNVANIDNEGRVHPDTMWWHHTLGNVKERPFSEIWADGSDPLMAGLRARPRPVGGRCASCRHLAICNGNPRVRALQVTGDAFAEDPGCYLTDAEIGVEKAGPRVTVTPFKGALHARRSARG